MKKIYTALIIVMLTICTSCSSSAINNAGKELEDALANASDSDNKYVQMVKSGYIETNPDLTNDNAFSAFFGTPRWKYFEGEDAQNIVEFTGDCTYQEVAVKARIQFNVDEENGTFKPVYLAFNEVPQNDFTMSALITKAFEFDVEQVSTETYAADKNSPIKEGDTVSASNEITENEAIKLLEEWLSTHPLNCEMTLEVVPPENVNVSLKDYYVIDLIPDGDKGASIHLLVNKYTKELSVFGDEADCSLDEWYEYSRFSVNYIGDDGDAGVDYSAYDNQNSDPALTGGRWVSDNGNRLEFFDDYTGTTNLDLWPMQFGWPTDGTKDITWEVSNGQVALIAHLTIEYKYDQLNAKELSVNNIPN